MAKNRSPNYPAISLPEAIEKVRAIHDKDRRNKVPKEVIAKHLGYAGLNGASLTVISALSKYGLLEGKGDAMGVTDAGVALLFDAPGSQERMDALRRAAGAPALFAELDKAFPNGAPSDAALEAHLMKRNFIRRAALDVIRAYRETKELVSQEEEAYNASTMREGIEEGTRIDRALHGGQGDRPGKERQGPQSTRLPSAEPDLVLKVGPDCYAVVEFKGGPVTQAAIDKLLDYFARNRDLYPERMPELPQADS